MAVSPAEVVAAFQTILGRHPGNEQSIEMFLGCKDLPELVAIICDSAENKEKRARDVVDRLAREQRIATGGFGETISRHKDFFLCPSDLTTNPLPRRKVLLIGQCFFFGWQHFANGRNLPVQTTHHVMNHLDDVPDHIMQQADDFDFQVVQVPMRVGIPERAYFRTPVDREEGFRHLFECSKANIRNFLNAMMKFNKRYGLETYVCGFVAPQAGFGGRFAPRYELSNALFYIDEINKFLFDLVKEFNNSYFVDMNAISAVHGKKFSRDDFIATSMHGGMLTDDDARIDAARILVPPPASDLYLHDPMQFVSGVWAEILAMHRTLHSVDTVKMVVVDLDDTLWRGLVGEGTAGDIIGWPDGFIEALIHLKMRGILLAIISKNDEAVVVKNWKKILGTVLTLEDFAVRKINYRPKAENMAEILSVTNLLSRNVVFIDDNPIEREAMKAAFPDIRVLGELPSYFKRVLMWSSETQVAHVSQESMRRTEMIQAQVVREEAKVGLTREAFLDGLGINIEIEIVTGPEHQRFARAFELINKTNQFNTTGIRLSHVDALRHFERGGVFYVFTVNDKHTAYGLVGVLVCAEGVIEQFVMSCRVAGLDVELGVLAMLMTKAAEHQASWQAKLIHTDANLLCQDVYAKAGFVLKEGQATNGIWERDLTREIAFPPHLVFDSSDSFDIRPAFKREETKLGSRD